MGVDPRRSTAGALLAILAPVVGVDPRRSTTGALLAVLAPVVNAGAAALGALFAVLAPVVGKCSARKNTWHISDSLCSSREHQLATSLAIIPPLMSAASRLTAKAAFFTVCAPIVSTRSHHAASSALFAVLAPIVRVDPRRSTAGALLAVLTPVVAEHALDVHFINTNRLRDTGSLDRVAQRTHSETREGGSRRMIESRPSILGTHDGDGML